MLMLPKGKASFWSRWRNLWSGFRMQRKVCRFYKDVEKYKLCFVLSFALLYIHHTSHCWSKVINCVWYSLWQSLNPREKISIRDAWRSLHTALWSLHCSRKTPRQSSTTNRISHRYPFNKRHIIFTNADQVLCKLNPQIFNWINPLVCMSDFY